jgi:hypothetical protein
MKPCAVGHVMDHVVPPRDTICLPTSWSVCPSLNPNNLNLRITCVLLSAACSASSPGILVACCNSHLALPELREDEA